MLSLSQTLAAQSETARTKVALTSHPIRYAVLAMLAGAYIGVGVVLMVAAAGPLAAAGNPLAKLVSGLVFAVALTLVVFAGGELATSNMMTLPQGVATRAVPFGKAAGTLGFCFVANLAGAVVFGLLVQFSGVLDSNAAAGEMIDTMLSGKAHYSASELFFRGVLCNLLVCLAIWMCARVTSEVAKLILIFWCILAFITSGFEHVVANMTTFTLGLARGTTTLAEFARNLGWVGLGNLVGGCLLVGLAYAVAAGTRGPTAATAMSCATTTATVPAAVAARAQDT